MKGKHGVSGGNCIKKKQRGVAVLFLAENPQFVLEQLFESH